MTIRRTSIPTDIRSSSKLPRTSRRSARVAARYWRLSSVTNYTVTFIGLNEVQWFTGATQQTASNGASSNSPSSGNVAQLRDNNLTTGATFASSFRGTLWLSFDLGASYEIDGLRYANSGSSSTRGLLSCDVQWSTDNTTWTTIQSLSSLSDPGGSILSATIGVQ